jgi:hypothetical protein
MDASDLNTLSEAQRAGLVTDLRRSALALTQSAKQLSQNQLVWKPAPDRWSIAECLEHVALVEKLLLRRLKQMANEPASEAMHGSDPGREAEVLDASRSRAVKWKAPKLAEPTSRYATLDAFDRDFAEIRAASIEFVRTTQAPLHAVVHAHPALGEMSGYQWLLFLTAHCERHTEQALEVRGTAGFPAI